MYGVYGELELFLPMSHSLKDRRRVVNALKSRLHSKFNMSVADISQDNLWQRAHLVFAMVASDIKVLENTLAATERSLSETPDFEVISFRFDYLDTVR